MTKGKIKVIRPAIVCLLVFSLICGIIYPLVVSAIAQICFKDKANGNIITVTLKDGKTVDIGSEYIAQNFTEAKYLIGRPMTDSKSATNLSPVSNEQEALVNERIKWLKEIDPSNTKEIPMDLVTVSGSGVDPHISVAAADYQIDRIAKERNIAPDKVKEVIEKYTDKKLFGVFGEETVNVLEVNLALDKLIGN